MLGQIFKKLLRKILGSDSYDHIRHQWMKWKENLKYFIYKAYRDSNNYGYDQKYYSDIEQSNQKYYELFAQTLFQEFQPSSLVDVGCGAGGISLAFMKAGCKDIYGFDYSSNAVEIAKNKGLSCVQQIDLTQVESIPAKADICVCLEVAEHIPQKYATHLCQLLASVSPILVFTAAPPGQGGHLHVNEKPQSYWIKLMKNFSMNYDVESVAEIKKNFAGKMIRDYDDNLMIFRKGT